MFLAIVMQERATKISGTSGVGGRFRMGLGGKFSSWIWTTIQGGSREGLLEKTLFLNCIHTARSQRCTAERARCCSPLVSDIATRMALKALLQGPFSGIRR